MKKYKFTNQVRSKAVAIANSLRAQGWNFSEALRQGWKVAKAWAAMQQDEIIIRFRKDGEEVPEQRTATLSQAYFSWTAKSTTSRKENHLQVRFWDTVKNAWRSFNAARFDGFAVAPLPF